MPPENPAEPTESPDTKDPTQEEEAYCFLDSTRPCNASCTAYIRVAPTAKNSLQVYQRCEPLNLLRRGVSYLEKIGKGP